MNQNKNTTHKHHTTKTTKTATKKIKNWPKYNKSLKNRGNLSIFISESVIKNGELIPPKRLKVVGRPIEYSSDLIELILTIRELFGLPLRQTTGLVEWLFGLMHLSGKIPDYTTLSRRSGKLNIRFSRKERREGIVMLIDSSGFKVSGEGEWMVRKHGATYRRTWRETHLAVDYETRNIVALINTGPHVHDNTKLRPLLKQTEENGCEVKTIIGDGAYDAKANYLLGRKRNIEFIAPPPKNATEHLNTGWHFQWYDTPGWEERNEVVRQIEDVGLDGWKADVGYHRRSLVENTFYRLKTIFGGNLKSRKVETQDTEQALRAKVINRFNELGLPKYEWVR